MNVGVGFSGNRNPAAAGAEAARAALKNAGIDKADFVMVHATVGYPQEGLLAAIQSVVGEVPIAGCSGGGVLASGGIANETNHAVVVGVFKSEKVKFTPVVGEKLSAGNRAAGKAIVDALGDNVKDGKVLMIFPDVLGFNFDELSGGVEEGLSGRAKLALIGGVAADNAAGASSREEEQMPMKTYQYLNGKVYTDACVAVLMSGDFQYTVEYSHGCRPMGEPHVITRADGNVILEIDNRPATEVLEEYLSEADRKEWHRSAASVAIGFEAPVELANDRDDGIVIRFIGAKDDAKKAIVTQVNVANGTKMWVSRRDNDKIIASVDYLTNRIKERFGGKEPTAVFQVECVGRGLAMWREDDKLAVFNRLQSRVGNSVPWLGFYAYGEIAPAGSRNFIHNWTSVVFALAA